MITRLLARVSALASMRQETRRQLDAFNGAPRNKSSETAAKRSRRLTASIWESRLRWRELRSRITGTPVIVVAISSQRLPIEAPLREAIERLIEPLPGCEGCPAEYLEDLRHATLLICEPAASSSLHGVARPRGELVVDERLLVHALAWSPVTAVRALIRCIAMLGLRAQNGSYSTASMREVAAAAAFTCVFDELFRGATRIRGLMVTSNSFSVEMLRFALLDRPATAGVLEVLHGVPTTPFAAYLESVYEPYRHGAPKHALIAQLPGLEWTDKLVTLMDSRRAINTLINHRLAGWVHDESALARRVEDMLGGPVEPGATIVSVIGGTSFDPDYRTSAAFDLECRLMAITRHTFAAHGRSCLFVYTPHPANRSGAFTECAELRRGDVRVYQDSILCWLAADLCIGLYSSGLFEARYLGASVFAPIRTADGLFDRRLLHMLSCANEDGDRLTAAQAWAEREARRPIGPPLIERAAQRLRLLRATPRSLSVPLSAVIA